MDCASDVSRALFDCLAHDLGFESIGSQDRFDPFPYGYPAESELGPVDYARHALLASAFKKSKVEEAADAEIATFEEFEAANSFCGSLSVESFRGWDGSPAVGYSIASAKDLLYKWLFKDGQARITMSSIEEAARFGPGSSVGLGGKPSSLYFKIGAAPMTAGSEFVRSWYESSVSRVPLCEAAEMARKASYGDIEVVSSGNLAFALKAFHRKRIVVTEPTLNTYFQLGLGAEVERVLYECTGIDFTTQPARNSELARRGSIDGSFATMDLKQCSDYISLALIKFMFPQTLFRWINLLRTKYVRYTVSCPGQLPRKGIMRIESFATMGNGFCFPIQTMLLSALVLGVYDTLGIHPNENWGVFGDDIIVVEEAYALLARVLKELGLVVNLNKSFSTGKFRESCGTDWFSGVDVRGVYLKEYTTDQGLLSAFNLLNLWSSHTGVKLSRTLAEILYLIEGLIPIVPPDEGLTAGVHSPEPLTRATDRGDSLVWWEYSSYVPVPVALSFEPWEDYCWESPAFHGGSESRKKQFNRWVSALQSYCGGIVNEPAALKVLLAGGLRRSRMSLRVKRVNYRLMVKNTPRWGFSCLDEYRKLGIRKYPFMTQNVVEAFDSLLTRLSSEK